MPKKARPFARRVAQVSVLGTLIGVPMLSAARGADEAPGWNLQGTLCSFGTDAWSISCPLGVVQTSLASRTLDLGLLASGLAFIVLAFVADHVFCSWLCPQGFFSELVDKLRTRLRSILRRPRPRPDTPEQYRRGQRFLYGFLALGLLASLVFGVPVFCYICPIGLLCRSLVGASYLGTVGGELAVVGLILLVELTLARRGWCKYICPVGALYGACTAKRPEAITRDADACEGCHSCARECSMGNSPVRDRVGRTCTSCGDCIEVCPAEALELVQLGARRSKKAES